MYISTHGTAEVRHRRKKRKLPSIRVPYKNYADTGIDWLQLFLLVDQTKQEQHQSRNKSILHQLRPDIEYETFKTRYRQWKQQGKLTSITQLGN